MKWHQALRDYSYYLKLERGLSENSIANYELDVEKLIKFLVAHDIQVSPIHIDKAVVQQFVYEIAKVVHPRSQARIISGLKSFFNYLVFEDYREDNPMALIEAPKTGRKLPDVLTIEDIDILSNGIDLSTNEGHRNKAIIETLYGCGLRVSELTHLRLSDLFLKKALLSDWER